MKLSLTTTISMASIVAAGAAAYAINVNVLEAPAATVPVAAIAAAPTTLATTASGQTSAQSVSAPVEIQAVSIDGNTLKYQIEGAGTILLSDTVNGLSVSGISPGAGWTSEPARVASDGAISVHFVSGVQRLEFIARKANGKITTTVTNENIPPTSVPLTAGVPVPMPAPAPGSVPAVGAKPAIPGTIGGDDHDDDDDEHEDDHGDRHEDDDD